MKNPSNNYYVQPRFSAKRNDSKIYAKAELITDKWKIPDKEFEGTTCGNVRPAFNIETKKFTWDSDTAPCNVGMYHAISSALLLYRLLCLFGSPVQVVPKDDQYKCIWWVTLEHKKSHQILQFGEWKAAAGIWTTYHSIEKMPASFKADILELLNLIVSRTCPHPYDGCVAGSVA